MGGYLIAVDGGGSTCRAALATRDGRILARGRAGPANIATDPGEAGASIAAAAQAAVADAGLPADTIRDCAALLGLAGARQAAATARTLLGDLPFSRMELTGDAEIALEGALGPGDGIMAILGTGSAFLARRDDEIRSVGGWGLHLADQGGGARLGREALRTALLARDGMRPHGPLSRALLAAFDDDPAQMVAFAGAARPADFGRFAPQVFDAADAGDPNAIGLLQAALADICEMIAHLDWPECPRIVLMGGLAPLYGHRLAAGLRDRLSEPQGDALDGAVRLAVRTFARG